LFEFLFEEQNGHLGHDTLEKKFKKCAGIGFPNPAEAANVGITKRGKRPATDTNKG
jgi:hypothetical protein